jgi:hypothetical protein
VNVEISQLQPGTPGVCHGGGIGGDLIRHATGSWAGHAFLYLGNNRVVQGTAPRANVVPADSWSDAIWFWRMWDQLATLPGWTTEKIASSRLAVVSRGSALIGTDYDWPAYVGFAAEILDLRNEEQLAPDFVHDDWRVCSALVADALTTGGVPLDFVPSDGPGLIRDPDTKVAMPPNLVAPGMLLGLAQRMEWT